MRFLIFFFVPIVITIGFFAGWAIRRAALNSAPANHLAMARWIDRQLMEGMVSTHQTDRAKQLLAEFYGTHRKDN